MLKLSWQTLNGLNKSSRAVRALMLKDSLAQIAARQEDKTHLCWLRGEPAREHLSSTACKWQVSRMGSLLPLLNYFHFLNAALHRRIFK